MGFNNDMYYSLFLLCWFCPLLSKALLRLTTSWLTTLCVLQGLSQNIPSQLLPGCINPFSATCTASPHEPLFKSSDWAVFCNMLFPMLRALLITESRSKNAAARALSSYQRRLGCFNRFSSSPLYPSCISSPSSQHSFISTTLRNPSETQIFKKCQ